MSGEPGGSASLPARVRRWCHRAAAYEGQERETAVLVLKAALAATLSWLVAHGLMGAATPAFAPFAALLMVEVTLYRSMLRSLRMVGAVLLGIALVTALAVLAGTGPAVFALAALAALVLGRWRRLGDQGNQVATAAFFAFATFVSLTGPGELLPQAAEILAVVLVGSAIGVAVNLVVLPPLRLRGAARAVSSLAGGLRRLCEDIGNALREGRPEPETAREWRSRADGLLGTARQAREATGTARESVLYNPRRLLHRRRVDVRDHDRLVDALERSAHQLSSVARSLERGRGEGGDGEQPPTRSTTARCGDLLLGAAAAWRVLEDWEASDGDGWDPPVEEFHAAVEAAERSERDLESACREDGGPPLHDPSLPYGVLLVESARLVDELGGVDEVLKASADPGGTRQDREPPRGRAGA
ncbi:Aromatic acid exporter family member 1 [Nocardiopsis flavescens]|uniref:Aromatic acid exporter family member 1 n=1 Tax=Nocardiopsis flavescens TaxID=758803 RepID=A0A1M6JBX4_9ACTN|nr:aromatic acid exporter family protein [Nocardiopsis flavescens]SHJ44181.1 Aromatic acid exporter family member 1 [Nocardiopsis flavescens]